MAGAASLAPDALRVRVGVVVGSCGFRLKRNRFLVPAADEIAPSTGLTPLSFLVRLVEVALLDWRSFLGASKAPGAPASLLPQALSLVLQSVTATAAQHSPPAAATTGVAAGEAEAAECSNAAVKAAAGKEKQHT